MHARLRVRRWGTLKVPILQGGWYPATPFLDEHNFTISVDDQPVHVSGIVLEVTAQPREKAVWGSDAKGGAAIVVCPAGHHLTDVAPARPRAFCERCRKLYEIET